MTSDAKIGLLLGLVFIFIIAFIINGLPNFHREKNSNELTTKLVKLQNSPPGIGSRERRLRREVIEYKKPTQNPQPPATARQDVRFTTPLPKTNPVAKKNDELKPTTPAPLLTPQQENRNPTVTPLIPPRPKLYIVCKGDNLSTIAKKFYGPQHGNKKINVTKIFEANSKSLKSKDKIYVGQKLIIPPLLLGDSDRNQASSVSSTAIFKKVVSIDKKPTAVETQKAKQSMWYVVQEGDNLWRIAAEQLDNANRYPEIAKLNADILDDEDNIVVGMRLKMPPR
jgi:nucleoid-associated protein YgaU